MTDSETTTAQPPDSAVMNVASAVVTASVIAHHHNGETVTGAWIAGDHGAPGDDDQDDLLERAEKLAGFVRANPGVPPEALYRFAHGQGLHTMPVDDWAKRPFWVRLCYKTFALILMHTDEAAKEEEANATAQLQADLAAKGPIPASALSADVRDTIMELQPDPLELNKGMTLVKVGDASTSADTAATKAENVAPVALPPVAGAANGAAETAASELAGDKAVPKTAESTGDAAAKPVEQPTADADKGAEKPSQDPVTEKSAS